MKRWIGWTVLATFVVAVVVHLATVIVIPYDIMNDTMTKKFTYPANVVLHAAPKTAADREVVRPSPDLLYSICLYDVSKYPLRFTALVPDSYWSVSGFASNTDNFFAINGQQIKSNPAEVLLVGKDMSYEDVDVGNAEVMVAPSDKGIVLFRVLIASADELDELMKVQKQASCKVEGAPAEAEAAEPRAEGELSFEAAEYANAEHGFSVKYPADWAEKETVGSQVFIAAAAAKVPVITVSVGERAAFADALTAALEESGNSDIEIGSESETTLADGTPATQVKVTFTVAAGYPADAFSLGVQKDGKWVLVTVTTVSMLVPYDEAQFSEIAHTLQFE